MGTGGRPPRFPQRRLRVPPDQARRYRRYRDTAERDRAPRALTAWSTPRRQVTPQQHEAGECREDHHRYAREEGLETAAEHLYDTPGEGAQHAAEPRRTGRPANTGSAQLSRISARGDRVHLHLYTGHARAGDEK